MPKGVSRRCIAHHATQEGRSVGGCIVVGAPQIRHSFHGLALARCRRDGGVASDWQAGGQRLEKRRVNENKRRAARHPTKSGELWLVMACSPAGGEQQWRPQQPNKQPSKTHTPISTTVTRNAETEKNKTSEKAYARTREEERNDKRPYKNNPSSRRRHRCQRLVRKEAHVLVLLPVAGECL